jgi:hypothetical protein
MILIKWVNVSINIKLAPGVVYAAILKLGSPGLRLTTILLLFSASLAIHSAADTSHAIDAATLSRVVVNPIAIEDILPNPGMGWQTFHATNKTAKNLPPWLPSTVQYARWGWAALETKPGQLASAFLDGQLAESRAAGQKLAFRVMCASTNLAISYCPDWLSAAGGHELLVDRIGCNAVFHVPDFDDPATLTLHLDFIRRLGARYDGNPDIDHVDLGSVGWWGEWHMTHTKLGKMPSPENCLKIIDAYLAAFKKTPLLMLIGGETFTAYALQHGTGWRADSMGDVGTFSPTWNHMRDQYPKSILKTGALNIWQTAPVAFEPPANLRDFQKKHSPLRWIYNYALALHPSYFNGKSEPFPEDPEFRTELELFVRRLGYRFEVVEFSHPPQVKPGGQLELSSLWRNVGSAPCYRPYRLAYRLSRTQDNFAKVFMSTATVKNWMPGSVEVFTKDFFKEPPDLPPGALNQVMDTITLPGELPAGKYTLSVGVVAEQTEDIVLRLAIAGRDDGGWYPLSQVYIAP